MLNASVPGNLLLFGEYAVTLPGGLGVAIGVEPRVIGIVEKAPAFAIHGTTGSGSFHWRGSEDSRPGIGGSGPGVPDAPTASQGLISSVLQVTTEASGFDIRNIDSLNCRITLDSSELYRSDGSKRGLGSSAAVSVLLAAILLRLFTGAPPKRDDVLKSALRAHRLSQGGRGSGYDVAASCFGGLGLFEGGEAPGWSDLAAGWIPTLWLFPGPREVATAPAIGNFERWREAEPDAFQAFVAASNAGVRELIATSSWQRAAPVATHLGELARKLGRDIGVPAEVPERLVTCLEKENHSSLEAQSTTIKAVGAGGELFVSFGYGEARTCPGGQEIRITEGLRWHT